MLWPPYCPPTPCHRVTTHATGSGAAPHCKDAAPSASRSLGSGASPKQGHPLRGQSSGWTRASPSWWYLRGWHHPIQRDPGTCSLREATVPCLSFPICTVKLWSQRRVDECKWLAEGASRVSNLTPRLGPGQGPFCSLPPSTGSCHLGGVSSPKVTRQMGLGADTTAPVPLCPSGPAKHPLQVLAIP